jgi:hypothetical protein
MRPCPVARGPTWLTVNRNRLSLQSRTASRPAITFAENTIMLSLILLIVLILLLLGSLPTWPYSGGWGYYPSGGLGLLLVIVLIMWLMGIF